MVTGHMYSNRIEEPFQLFMKAGQGRRGWVVWCARMRYVGAASWISITTHSRRQANLGVRGGGVAAVPAPFTHTLAFTRVAAAEGPHRGAAHPREIVPLAGRNLGEVAPRDGGAAPGRPALDRAARQSGLLTGGRGGCAGGCVKLRGLLHPADGATRNVQGGQRHVAADPLLRLQAKGSTSNNTPTLQLSVRDQHLPLYPLRGSGWAMTTTTVCVLCGHRQRAFSWQFIHGLGYTSSV